MLDLWKVKSDHAHELAVLQVQADMARAGHQYRMEEVNTQADIASEQAVYKQAEQKPTGVRWVDGLLALYSGTIRPTVTYLFMGSYIFVKYAQLKVVMAAGGELWGTIWQLWNSEDMAAFMTIIGFWFGSRMLKHNMEVFGIGKDTNGNGNGVPIAKPAPVLVTKPRPSVGRVDGNVKPKPGEILNDSSTNNLSGF